MTLKKNVPADQLASRLTKLRELCTQAAPDWEAALVTRKANTYYLTGTLAGGALWLPREGDAIFFVREGLGRTLHESNFPRIEPMRSYRDIRENVPASFFQPTSGTFLVEKDNLPVSLYESLDKHLTLSLSFGSVGSLSPILHTARSVKSAYEIELLEQAGRIHREVLIQAAPSLLVEGISEAELATELYAKTLSLGSDGAFRTNLTDQYAIFGYVNFGESSLVPTNFPTPDGTVGISPANLFFGSRERKLRKNDVVFLDCVCSYQGYLSDKSRVYYFGDDPSYAVASAPAEVATANQICADMLERMSQQLRPGVRACDIYNDIYENVVPKLSPKQASHFQGPPGQLVSFLGHGTGLCIDELPTIAARDETVLQENMVIALEPKMSIPGVGMVGVEETFVVTEQGGRQIT